MEDQIEAFIGYLATRRRYAPNTLLAYRNDLVNLCQFIRAERPRVGSWSHVDGLTLQAYTLHLRAEEYSAASIARKIAACKTFYFFLLENGQIVTNPTDVLEAPAVPKQLPHALHPEQVAALLESVSGTTPKALRDRAMLEVLYAAGLRVSELIALQLNSWDAAAGTVRVDSQDQSRVLELSERASIALAAYLQQGRAELAWRDGPGPLFVNSRGERLTRQGVWLILKESAKKAGIEGDVTPHSLRHAFATHRLARGERIEDLQKLLGHAHLSTTLVYSRAQQETART